ncbi:MAG: hypothetical protein R2747_23840 [Pyrinomonadaceae bacterium]
MKRQIFFSHKSGQTGNFSLTHFAIIVFLAAVFLGANISLIKAQSPKIPTPGSNGNFGDIQVDGDRIKIQTIQTGGKPGKLQIKIDADGAWWKMLRVIDKNGNANYIEQQDGRLLNNQKVIEIDANNLNATFKLEFWKAKLFGIHTYIMSEIYRKQDFEGRIIKFIWKEGLEGDDSDLTSDLTAPINETLKIEGKPVTIRSTDDGRAGYATIKFQTDADWWTAVKMFERNGSEKLIEKTDGRYKPGNRTLQMPISQFPSEIKLEFWTAKFLGVHTYMAGKKLNRERFDGRTVTITWGRPTAPINESVKIEGKAVTIRSTDSGTKGYVTIKFNTNLDWWTALRMIDRNGRAKLIQKENGRYNPGTQTLKIPVGDFSSNINLELWTAKAFGIHTFMAAKAISAERFDGRIVTINWYK